MTTKTIVDTKKRSPAGGSRKSSAKAENTKRWVEFWNASVTRKETVTDEMQAARWNERAGDFGRHADSDKRKKRITDLLAFLKEAGFTPKGKKILDIGCGPGALSIPLAQAGAKVTSFDIASGMLDRIREVARAEDLKITIVEGSWWSADIDTLGFRGAFDLVIASSTPAIRDAETFDRMMACSKKFCYYNGVFGTNGATEKETKKSLPEILGIESGRGHAFGPGGRAHGGPGLMYAFMYLYTLGYQPRIKFNSRASPDMGWAEAAERAIGRFGQDRNLTAVQKQKIKNYYKSTAVDGVIRHEPANVSGMMVWNVKT